ncbi:hypothetical protein MRX96_011676 [Rhipicephalus microplus]
MVLEYSTSRSPRQPSSSTMKTRHHRQQQVLADVVTRAPTEAADSGDTVDGASTKTHLGALDVANATNVIDTTSGGTGSQVTYGVSPTIPHHATRLPPASGCKLLVCTSVLNEQFTYVRRKICLEMLCVFPLRPDFRHSHALF